MGAENHHLLQSLAAINEEIKSIHKRIDHNPQIISRDDLKKCTDIINNSIRELDHAVEKLQGLFK